MYTRTVRDIGLGMCSVPIFLFWLESKSELITFSFLPMYNTFFLHGTTRSWDSKLLDIHLIHVTVVALLQQRIHVRDSFDMVCTCYFFP